MDKKDIQDTQWETHNDIEDKKKGKKKIRWFPSRNDEQIIDELLKVRGRELSADTPPLQNNLFLQNLTVNNIFAVLALIDIAGPAKNIRGIPNFFHLGKKENIIGIARKADIKIDDPDTVSLEHAIISFYDMPDNAKKGFAIKPIKEAPVHVNGMEITDDWFPLEHGSIIKIGSAVIIFLQTVLIQDNEDI